MHGGVGIGLMGDGFEGFGHEIHQHRQAHYYLFNRRQQWLSIYNDRRSFGGLIGKGQLYHTCTYTMRQMRYFQTLPTSLFCTIP